MGIESKTARTPMPPLQESVMNSLELSVVFSARAGDARPVNGGVPVVKGAAPRGAVFSLFNARGRPVPVQSKILARWQDGSARWVLLDFLAEQGARAREKYQLRWSRKANGGKTFQSAAGIEPVRVSRSGRTMRCGNMELAAGGGALLRVPGRAGIFLDLTMGNGRQCEAAIESFAVEASGPVRGTLRLEGAFKDKSGRRMLGFRMRVSMFSGLPQMRLEPMLLADAGKGVILLVRELKLVVAPEGAGMEAIIGGKPAWKGSVTNNRPVRLFQVDDRQYRLEESAAARFDRIAGKGGRAPGWAELRGRRGSLALALRDFWQQWPKSIEFDGKSLALGLLPRFAAGTFSHMNPWYKHQYFFKGSSYRLRTGQARRWDIWMDLAGGGERLAACANAPLAPAADPAIAVASGVWGAIAPAGAKGVRPYDKWAEALFAAYQQSIARQRDYGAMNWGDWFGERNVNWGNHEYDTPNQILVQFARTADPEYLLAGETAARHMSEVDVINFMNDDLKSYFEVNFNKPSYPCRPGMVHEHCVGHVGSFYSREAIRRLFVSFDVGKTKKPYLCLDPYNLGHVWTQGMVRAYFLTGDPWFKEVVGRIGDNLAQLVEDRVMKFARESHSGRVNGWTMLALAGAYELDWKKRYLKAMKTLANDKIDEQDSNCGGWLYNLGWGHCFCRSKKHVGEAGFLTSVQVNGLSRYYELTGDPRIPGVIRRAITNLNNDTWREEWMDWRYTSCPASPPIHQIGVTIMALVNSARLTGDAEHRRILKTAWEFKFKRLKSAQSRNDFAAMGKSYALSVYGAAEAAAMAAGGPVWK